MWKKACQDAGVPGRYFHDYRRTAVRNMEHAGVPRSSAMKISGHRTESTYRRYAIVDQAAMMDAVKRIEADRIQRAEAEKNGKKTSK